MHRHETQGLQKAEPYPMTSKPRVRFASSWEHEKKPQVFFWIHESFMHGIQRTVVPDYPVLSSTG